MRVCPGHLLPTFRSLHYRKLQSEFVLRLHLCLHNAKIPPSAAVTRFFSKCAAAKWRSFGKGQKETLSKQKRVDDQNARKVRLAGPKRIVNSALWIEALEPLLQPHLRASSYTGNGSTLNADEKCIEITRILAEAREEDNGLDVLSELGVKHGRWSAVMSIVESLIAGAAARITNESSAQLPSNLDWPMSTLDDADIAPIELDAISYSHTTCSARWDEFHFDPRNTDSMATEKYTAIEQIWMSLGFIILESANLPSAPFTQAMKYVYQIIARLHSSGFVPEHVYTYVHTLNDSTVRRPPIMHLLSSRILTTLSDAVWRAHQDKVIAQAASAGASYRDLGRDPPGGRFRLKVRELGPEVWLEFVLWCCVDGGFAKAGSSIVERMRSRNTDSPWFANQWTSAAGDGAADNELIDWDRVKLRHGGSVGQIEGYSRERPFVEMGSRTISVEVVLALVETVLNDRSADVAGRGCPQGSALTAIEKLLLFLEPHGLPEKYFDYLTVRLLQPLLFDFETDPTALQSLAERLGYIRSLETTHKPAEYLPSLRLTSVFEQSEVYAGLLHQALESLTLAGRVHPSVAVFGQIQELVDRSKLRAIESFLHTPRRPGQSFFSARDFAFSQEYTSSHGQLPAQKLALFLDMVTEAGMTDLGQWLLYSMDVDGPLIPLDLYGQSSLSPSVLRFAASTKDHMLIEDVADSVLSRRPDVSYMRSLADAKVQLREFTNAGHAFEALAAATGGGNSIGNVACIIATILRIEHSAEHAWKERRPRLLSPPLSLLDCALEGDFQGIAGGWKREHRKEYRRGLACLLRIVEAIPGTVLSNVARSWIPRLGGGNVVGLRPQVFDMIISAIVDTKGAKVGMMLWDLFCELPVMEGEENQGWVDRADIKLVATPKGPELQPKESPLPGSRVRSRSRFLPVRIDKSNTTASTAADVDLDLDDNSEDAMFEREHGVGLAANLSDGGVSGDNAVPEESSFNIDESAVPGIPGNEIGVAGTNAVPGDTLSLPKEKLDPTPLRDPPRADISLIPQDFQAMFSEDTVTPGASEDDEVAPHTSSAHIPSPVVRPTFRTLRIIVRAALQELETAKKLWYTEDIEVPINVSETPSKANMRLLEAAMADIALVEEWAKPLFRKFGLSNEDVAAEFGWKFGGEDSIFSTEDLKRRYEAAESEYRLAKKGLLADLSEVNIRKRFLGPPIRFTEVDVKKYTSRELAFFGPKKTGS